MKKINYLIPVLTTSLSIFSTLPIVGCTTQNNKSDKYVVIKVNQLFEKIVKSSYEWDSNGELIINLQPKESNFSVKGVDLIVLNNKDLPKNSYSINLKDNGCEIRIQKYHLLNESTRIELIPCVDLANSIRNYFGAVNLGDTKTVLKIENIDNLSYSLDSGSSWIDYSTTPINSVEPNQVVLFKANNPNGITTHEKWQGGIQGLFEARHGTFCLMGSIMSLIDNGAGTIDTIPSSHCFLEFFIGSTALKYVSKNFLPATKLAERCYQDLFQRCRNLAFAPNLPAQTLDKSCYNCMFEACESLTVAPALPATNLTEACYSGMFLDCDNLVIPPELPAAELTDACYSRMFEGCKKLAYAPDLPAIKIALSCYSQMFVNCESIVNPPKLPATDIKENCYKEMFVGCTNLTSAPDLPATELKFGSYGSMFVNCINIVYPAKMNAVTLAPSCCAQMYANCLSLTAMPNLPAKVIEQSSYYGMFLNCVRLKDNINLGATSLSNGTTHCKEMFSGCRSITEAPVINITNFLFGCFENMFKNCVKLNVYKTSGEGRTKFFVTNETPIDGYAKDMFASTGTQEADPVELNTTYYFG